MERKKDNDRGISPTIGVVLMVAFVVLLAAAVGTTVLGFGDDVEDVPQSEFDARYSEDTGGSFANEIILTNVAGDGFDVSNVEITVRTPDEEARLVNLPIPNCPTNAEIDQDHTSGEKFFKGGCAWGGALGESDDNTWKPGSRARIVLADTSTRGPDLSAGDTVEVEVVHTPSDSLVGSDDFTVGE
jgi:flagellin-like protein